MATDNKAKHLAKKAVKKSLILTKKVLSKSKVARRIGRGVRNVLFPGGPNPNVYDHTKYAASIAEYRQQMDNWQDFKQKPLISVVMPTYNTPTAYLEACLDSVLIQSYPNWELCIADDASPSKSVVEVLKRYAARDKRIKYMVRKKNGHISAATNSAIELASGKYMALLDHDDVLWPNALYEIVAALNDNPGTDFVYTDEDKVDEKGEVHSYPVFKPRWSPEFLESCNYITHFACVRTDLVRQIGGMTIGREGAQDWDLFVRLSEVTDKIVHVPKVLYSWRVHEDSTAMSTDAKPYVYEAQRKLLGDHVERSGRSAKVKQGIIVQHCSIEYQAEGSPLVSVVIYENDAAFFQKSIESTLAYTTYQNIEMILASSSAKGVIVASKYKDLPNFKTIKAKDYAQACNYAAKQAAGEYLVFIDGNMLVNTKHWLELMLGDAQRDGVAVIGGKTLNATKERIMRAGIGMGIYGLYAPLLEGMEVHDIHYMRGLYGQSRRNSSAVDSGCLMVKASVFKDLGGLAEDLDDMAIVDLCLKVVDLGQRVVYNPFIETVDLANLTAGDSSKNRDEKAISSFKKKWSAYIDDDPYFDPGFTRCNAQMEIN